MNNVKWCRPSFFTVNFEPSYHPFLAFSIGYFEQVIAWNYIKFTSSYSNFMTSNSCLLIYTLILNFIIYRFIFKSSKAILNWVFWKTLCIFSMFTFSFTSTEFLSHNCDAIRGNPRQVKLMFMLHGKNMPIILKLKFQPCC